jgi:hypothetical protein
MPKEWARNKALEIMAANGGRGITDPKMLTGMFQEMQKHFGEYTDEVFGQILQEINGVDNNDQWYAKASGIIRTLALQSTPTAIAAKKAQEQATRAAEIIAADAAAQNTITDAGARLSGKAAALLGGAMGIGGISPPPVKMSGGYKQPIKPGGGVTKVDVQAVKPEHIERLKAGLSSNDAVTISRVSRGFIDQYDRKTFDEVAKQLGFAPKKDSYALAPLPRDEAGIYTGAPAGRPPLR